MSNTGSQLWMAALYMRLSRDDEGSAESASITSQRQILRAYARDHGYTVYDEYVDDGVSGTTFDRPAFRRMLMDIEDKRINMVLTKDLSRLGRDYIQTGQYTELYFPAKQVRYIAINDGYDSDSPFTDIAPFKNILNEMYARDTSKKIRSAFQARMQEGAFIGAFPPYGYQRDPADRHHLVADPGSAPTVAKIFQKAACGMPPAAIARELNVSRTPTPMEYRCFQHPHLQIEAFSKRREWTSSTISKLLKNPVYLGHMVQGKTCKYSFKQGASTPKPQKDWIVVEHTHTPLVTQTLFDRAGRYSRQRICTKTGQFHNLFSGIARCADCGKSMSAVGSRKKGTTATLTCSGYKRYGRDECTNHFIDYDALCALLLESIQTLLALSPREMQEILEAAQQKIRQRSPISDAQREAAVLEKRSQRLESLIRQLYEDYAAGLLQEEHRKKMLQKYQEEGQEIAGKLRALRVQKRITQSEAFRGKLKQQLQACIQPEALTRTLVTYLVDHVEIGQGCYRQTERGKMKEQTVRIYFRCRGMPSEHIYIQ